MNRKRRRIGSFLLAAVLMLTCLPAMALAEETENPDGAQPEEIVEEMPESQDLPGLYFGLLHSHTTLSDGALLPGSLAESCAGLDFLGLTDHSDSLTAEEWAGMPAAEQPLLLRGYEMSWPEQMLLGHIGVFGTENFRAWQEDAYDDYYTGLENFYAALAAEPAAVGQFQHPGDFYGKFKNFAFHPGADQVISLLEVACEGETYYSAYTAALDKGWHVSPTFGTDAHGTPAAGAGRTVVQLEELTEAGLLSALKNRRTYATEDGDLQILYSLDGYDMGAIQPRRRVGPTAEIDMTLHDPTDENIGKVEIVGPGNVVAATVSVDANPERITLSLPSDRAYYFLRVIQPDGDIALTAPVWIQQTESAGISAFVCDTPVPVQNNPVDLTVTLFNEETVPLEVTRMELWLDDERVELQKEPFSVAPGSAPEISLRYVHGKLGESDVTLLVTAKLEGETRTYEKSLHLSARRKEQVSEILVDGGHGDPSGNSYAQLSAMAAKQNIRLTLLRQPASEEDLAECALLIIPSPAEDFSDAFLETVREYVAFGGQLMVCADDPARAGELNRLLATVGATAYYGAELPEHRPQEFNREDPLCAGIRENQVFRMMRGCAVEPGSGTWLVKGQEILMARENLPGGGRVLVCGSLIAEEEALKEPDYLWDEPYANRTILLALLGVTSDPTPLSQIRQVREGENGEIYRIRGYVTSAAFPGMLFLQDATGGMAVSPFAGKAGLGQAVEVSGTLTWQEGEPVLHPISRTWLDHPGYRYQPQSLNCRQAQDGGNYGGLLVQVTGVVKDRTLGGDGAAREFVLQDSTGRKLRVVIGENTVSASTGRNDLHAIVEKGKEIWAIGILRTDAKGATFLQVRNCDEVVAVAPNPYTGDSLQLWLTAMLLAAAGLVLLRRRRNV